MMAAHTSISKMFSCLVSSICSPFSQMPYKSSIAFYNLALTLSIMSGVIMMAAYKDLSNLHISSSVWPLIASIVITTA